MYGKYTPRRPFKRIFLTGTALWPPLILISAIDTLYKSGFDDENRIFVRIYKISLRDRLVCRFAFPFPIFSLYPLYIAFRFFGQAKQLIAFVSLFTRSRNRPL